MNFIADDDKETLGFLKILEKLEILSPYGRNLVDNLQPFTDTAYLQNEFDNMQKLRDNYISNQEIYADIEVVLAKFKNILNSLSWCERGYVLDEVELYEIKNFALLTGELIKNYDKLNMHIETINLISISDIVRLLNPHEKIFSTFYVYDQYSEQLKNLRKEKRKIEKEIFNEKDYVRINSLKHNRIDIVVKEQNEELRIKKILSAKIKETAKRIRQNIMAIGNFDFLLAKIKLAQAYNLSQPIIANTAGIKMTDGIFPAIENFTPISIELKKGATIITGANMGGKSLTLKLIALNTLLAHMGFYVFAREFIFSRQNFIYFVSADMQCVSQGLSTFGAEIIKIKEIIAAARKGTGLIILDEFARGTNPYEGSKLVKALARYLNGIDSISVITTHYDGVASKGIIHYEVRGLKDINWNDLKLNGLLTTEKLNLQNLMDYRMDLVNGVETVPRDALNICRLLGLEQTVITYAEEYYEDYNIRGNKIYDR